jgi:long-chain acyl-CoA synthetase
MATVPEMLDAPMGVADWRQVWLDSYACDMPSTVPYPQAPLTALLETAARRFPDRPGCTIYGRSTSFGQLSDQSRRLARALVDLGAKPGRHVGLLLPNIPEYLVALQAVWLTGATALQLSPLMVAEEVGHWLEATGCHIVVTLDLLAPAVVGSLKRGPLEHLVLTSLARRMAMWRGMLYRMERLRRSVCPITPVNIGSMICSKASRLPSKSKCRRPRTWRCWPRPAARRRLPRQ